MTNIEQKNNCKLQGKVNEENFNYINDVMGGTFNEKISSLVGLHKDYVEKSTKNKLVVTDKVSRIKDLSSRMFELTEEIVNDANNFVADYIASGLTSINELTEQNIKYEELQNKHITMNEELEKTKEELSGEKSNNEHMAKEIEELRKNIEQLEKEKAEIEAEKNKLDRDNLNKIETQLGEIKELTTKVSDLENKNNYLKIEVAGEKAKNEINEKDIQGLSDTVAELRSRISDLMQDKNTLTESLRKSQDHIKELSKLPEANDKLRSEKAALERKVEVKNSSIELLEKQAKRLERENKLLQNKISPQKTNENASEVDNDINE